MVSEHFCGRSIGKPEEKTFDGLGIPNIILRRGVRTNLCVIIATLGAHRVVLVVLFAMFSNLLAYFKRYMHNSSFSGMIRSHLK